MNPLNIWKGKLEAASFLPSKNLYRQCVLSTLLNQIKLLHAHHHKPLLIRNCSLILYIARIFRKKLPEKKERNDLVFKNRVHNIQAVSYDGTMQNNIHGTVWKEKLNTYCSNIYSVFNGLIMQQSEFSQALSRILQKCDHEHFFYCKHFVFELYVCFI